MPKINIHSIKDINQKPKSQLSDLIIAGLVFCLIFLVLKANKTMGRPFDINKTIHISLAVKALPGYALRSVIRMFYALMVSLLATFVFGTIAAKSKYAERIIIPLIDILQSIPILGFLSIGIPVFIKLFPGSLWGPECAAILTIFTSQAWNMILSFYQSLKTIPKSMREVAKVFNLNKWQIFWRIEVPFAMPSLLWNTMLSLSAGWFFVVGSEAFIYDGNQILLPGIGSYIARAVEVANYNAIYNALIAMLLIIAIYDQILFRPMIAWAQKFNLTGDHFSKQSSWLIRLIERSHIKNIFSNINILSRKANVIIKTKPNPKAEAYKAKIWLFSMTLAAIAVMLVFYEKIYNQVEFSTIMHICILGALTMLRVMVMIAICCLIWVPIGVYIGLKPKLALKTQTFIQFLAAFPTNLLFPFMVGLILKYKLNIDIWSAPLLVLGTQWYILFNVIAGTMSLPESLHDASSILRLRDIIWWRSLVIPGIFPHLLTGVISAAGGAWNASILAEALSWGEHSFYANGIGAYIAFTQKNGQVTEMALAIIIMCAYVLIINRLVWQPLYHLSQKRFTN